MSSSKNRDDQKANPEVPDPQGRLLGMPYDVRRPTVARVRSRLWNAADHRLFTPKSFGWGYDINFYWLAHPMDYLKADRSGHRD